MTKQELNKKIIENDGFTQEVTLIRFDEYSPYKWGVEIKYKEFGVYVGSDDYGFNTKKAAEEFFDGV